MPHDGGGRIIEERFVSHSHGGDKPRTGKKTGSWADIDTETQNLMEGLQKLLPENLLVIRQAGPGPLVLFIEEKHGLLGLGRRLHATYEPVTRKVMTLKQKYSKEIAEAVRQYNTMHPYL